MSDAPPTPPRVPQEPLIPRTPMSGAAVGGFGATILAALGFVASEVISLEQKATLAIERVTAASLEVNRRLTATEEAIQTLRERMATFERALLDQRRETRP